jgi:hypothetical protein
VAHHDEVERIQTREDLAAFVERLKLDYESNPAGWENGDLASFLEALGAWVEDMSGYFENRGEDIATVPPWRLLGMMLLAARSYE